MRRRHQHTCNCPAYSFPHRFGGGSCQGHHLVEQSLGGSFCGTCHLNNSGCEVMKGQEHPRECPAVQDFIQYWEIKL